MAKYVLFSVFTILFATGCKPVSGTADSSTKSLENFAAGEILRVNQCRGNPATTTPDDRNDIPVHVDLDDKGREYRYKNLLEVAMSAIPADQKVLLRLDNAKFLVTSNKTARDLCGSDRLPQNPAGATSCFLKQWQGSADSRGLTFVLSDSPAYVGHMAVRLVGYAMGQYYARKFSTVEDGKMQETNGLEFDLLAERLATAFLLDVAKPKSGRSIFSTGNLAKTLGPEYPRKFLQSVKSGDKSPLDSLSFKTRDRKTRQALRQAFVGYVMGEAFDSYHCIAWDDGSQWQETAARRAKNGDLSAFKELKHTRRMMEVFFERTYAAYQPVDKHLTKLNRAAVHSMTRVSGQPVAYPSQNRRVAPAQSGFGLQSSGPQGQDQDLFQRARGSSHVRRYIDRVDHFQNKRDNCGYIPGCRSYYDRKISEAQLKVQAETRNMMRRIREAETNQYTEETHKGGNQPLDVNQAAIEAANESIERNVEEFKEFTQDGRELTKQLADQQLALAEDLSVNGDGGFLTQLAAGYAEANGTLINQTGNIVYGTIDTGADTLGETAKGIHQLGVNVRDDAYDYGTDANEIIATTDDALELVHDIDNLTNRYKLEQLQEFGQDLGDSEESLRQLGKDLRSSSDDHTQAYIDAGYSSNQAIALSSSLNALRHLPNAVEQIPVLGGIAAPLAGSVSNTGQNAIIGFTGFDPGNPNANQSEINEVLANNAAENGALLGDELAGAFKSNLGSGKKVVRDIKTSSPPATGGNRLEIAEEFVEVGTNELKSQTESFYTDERHQNPGGE